MALTKDSFIKMNDGHLIPVLGLGTYAPEKFPKSPAKEATKVAIDAGFRHIDSAFVYQNEVEVGEAIREMIADGTVKREDIFYTGKLWSTFHSPELVKPALMKTLKALQLDYIDLYISHTPLSLTPGEDPIPVDENGKWKCIDVDLRKTWEVPKSHAKEATKVAIDAGFSHIDSAFIYQNEVEVGEAIREKIADGTVKREDIFYTGKLWATFHSPELVRPALMKSLKALQLDYIDLYIIHMPISLTPGEDLLPVDENGKWKRIDVDLHKTWEALEACKDEGLVRSIGVSNFTESQLEMILNKPGLKHKPACNQVECHVYLNQKKLLEFCKAKDIVLVAYSVLGSSRDEKWIDQKSPVLLDDPVLIKIAQKYKKSSAQVAMRYLLQQGIVVLAKSFNPERIKQNLQVFDFNLTAEDMKVIDGLNRNMSYVKMPEVE